MKLPVDVKHLKEVDKIKLLRNFNAVKPVTDYNPEFIYLINFQGKPVMFFVTGACVELIEPVPMNVVMRWLSSLAI